MSKEIKLSSRGAFSYHWNNGIESNNSFLIRSVKSLAVFFRSLFCRFTINKNEVDTFFSTDRHGNSVFAKECKKKFLDMDIYIVVNKTYQKHTQLMTAAREGNKEILEMLLKSAEASSLDEADSLGFTPLHMAAIGNHVECLNLLLEGGADFNKVNNVGRTPLHCAAMEIGAEECGKRLLGMTGIDVNVEDHSGNTALHHACNHGEEEFLKVLLENTDIDVDKLDKYKNTAIYRAFFHDHLRCAYLLLDNKEHKVDVNKRSGFNNETLLHHAINNESTEFFNKLLEDDDIDISLMDDNNRTPYDCVLRMDTPEGNNFFKILREYLKKHKEKK